MQILQHFRTTNRIQELNLTLSGILHLLEDLIPQQVLSSGPLVHPHHQTFPNKVGQFFRVA